MRQALARGALSAGDTNIRSLSECNIRIGPKVPTVATLLGFRNPLLQPLDVVLVTLPPILAYNWRPFGIHRRMRFAKQSDLR